MSCHELSFVMVSLEHTRTGKNSRFRKEKLHPKSGLSRQLISYSPPSAHLPLVREIMPIRCQDWSSGHMSHDQIR